MARLTKRSFWRITCQASTFHSYDGNQCLDIAMLLRKRSVSPRQHSMALRSLGAILIPIILCAATQLVSAQPLLSSVVAHTFAFAAQQLTTTTTELSPGSYPSITGASGSWQTTGAGSWTSGFLAGSLWLMYQHTGDVAWKARA